MSIKNKLSLYTEWNTTLFFSYKSIKFNVNTHVKYLTLFTLNLMGSFNIS